MLCCRDHLVAITFAATLCTTLAPASAADIGTLSGALSDFNGQWVRAAPRSQWDPTKPRGLDQQAPLTAEYEALFKANLKSLHEGNLGADQADLRRLFDRRVGGARRAFRIARG